MAIVETEQTLHYFVLNACLFRNIMLYQRTVSLGSVFHWERPIFLDVIVSVIVRKNSYEHVSNTESCLNLQT